MRWSCLARPPDEVLLNVAHQGSMWEFDQRGHTGRTMMGNPAGKDLKIYEADKLRCGAECDKESNF